eukprot:CAMPEP_0184684610 /NCGR_PEP_ID=MMETSP0312-20130426/15983_1 /TAXON_ID=31354 /ORGANISM="Compsopogon coeruleus, Strain SAG 36.94" /LENGTH=90 /DNA_ID=CAMNT_0027137953 /DNA_START=190 /DNA_END=459 /DNA_ORIENTATION=-
MRQQWAPQSYEFCWCGVDPSRNETGTSVKTPPRRSANFRARAWLDSPESNDINSLRDGKNVNRLQCIPIGFDVVSVSTLSINGMRTMSFS